MNCKYTLTFVVPDKHGEMFHFEYTNNIDEEYIMFKIDLVKTFFGGKSKLISITNNETKRYIR